MKCHTISAARRVGKVVGVKVTIGEIGGVAEPRRAAVPADELRRDVYKVALFAEMPHVNHHLPRSRDPLRFKDISVEPRDGITAVGDAHQVSLEWRVIRHRDAAAVIIPIDERLDLPKVARPDRAS